MADAAPPSPPSPAVPPPAPPPPPVPGAPAPVAPSAASGSPEQLTADEKLWGMLSYLIFPMLLGAIIGLVTQGKSKFVKFHALQMIFCALGMFALYICIWVFFVVLMFIPLLNVIVAILMIPFIALLGIGWLALIVIMGLKANSGQIYKLPLVGNLAYRSAYGGS